MACRCLHLNVISGILHTKLRSTGIGAPLVNKWFLLKIELGS